MATQKKILTRKNKATPRTVEVILDAISLDELVGSNGCVKLFFKHIIEQFVY